VGPGSTPGTWKEDWGVSKDDTTDVCSPTTATRTLPGQSAPQAKLAPYHLLKVQTCHLRPPDFPCPFTGEVGPRPLFHDPNSTSWPPPPKLTHDPDNPFWLGPTFPGWRQRTLRFPQCFPPSLGFFFASRSPPRGPSSVLCPSPSAADRPVVNISPSEFLCQFLFFSPLCCGWFWRE